MERQNQAEDLSGPMKMIFNYNNIFFSFFYDDTSGCIHRSREYAMNYVPATITSPCINAPPEEKGIAASS